MKKTTKATHCQKVLLSIKQFEYNGDYYVLVPIIYSVIVLLTGIIVLFQVP